LLVSRPKLGKSWLLQQIASAVAIKGANTLVSEPPADGDVLHLTLEDSERRFQRRMKKYFGADRSTWPARMTIATKWRHLDKGGIDDIREWCKSVPSPTLVTIDTLKKVRPATKGKDANYGSDYEANEQLVQLCHDFPGLAILVAHHDRKMDADDPFDTVSGTLGLTGGVDAIAILKRHRQGVTLYIQGRDLLDSVEKAVNFDRETGRRMILGEAGEVHRSKDERAVIEALRAAADGLKVQAITLRVLPAIGTVAGHAR
jgi:AAA domain